jgi:hypothetical protein
MRIKYNRVRKNQAGYFLIQLTLALILSSLAALEAMKASAEADRLAFAGIQGQHLQMVSAAGKAYIADNFVQLQTGADITRNGTTIAAGSSSGQTYAPSIENLVSLGYLESSFTSQSVFTNGVAPGNYQVRVWREPSGCEATSTSTCNVKGWGYIDKPIYANGSAEPDGPAISAMLRPLDGAGGFSSLIEPATVYGLGKKWSQPNPVAGSPAGVVGVFFAYVGTGLTEFLRLNDDRNPNLRGDLTVEGKVKGASYLTSLKAIGSSCDSDQENAIASSAAAVVICTGGVWKSLGEQSLPGAACSPEGKVATSTATGEQLICRSGAYIKSSSLIPKNILVQRVSVKDLDMVSKPVCDSPGQADRSFTITQTSTDVTVAPPKQSMIVSTTDLGSSWQVVIRMRDDLGNETSGNAHNITAVINLECKY